MKKISIFILILVLSVSSFAQDRKYDVAAFLYPAYAADDPRLTPFWPKGIGEWETVMSVQERWLPQTILSLDCVQVGLGNGSIDPLDEFLIKKNHVYAFSFRLEGIGISSGQNGRM